MFKNTASQKVAVFAFDSATGAPKTGDSGNITVYVSKDWGGVNALTDTSATEIDSTNAKGWYLFDISQTETNADLVHLTGKSATSGVVVVGQIIQTVPASWIVPIQAGTGTGQLDFTSGVLKSNLTQVAGVAVDPNTAQLGTNAVKLGGTTQTGRDIGASVIVDTTNRPGIRKNTALANFEFLMTDSTNHNPATGLTVSVTRSIDGGSFSGGTLSAVSAVSNGIYKVDFGAGDLNGDVVTLRCTATGADDLFVTIKTSP